jgi:CxxC-x17-CxxC domain-containing protein
MLQGKRRGRFHAPKSNRFKHPRSYKVVCSGCGKEVITPVFPPDDKKLLCLECFSKSGILMEET